MKKLGLMLSLLFVTSSMLANLQPDEILSYDKSKIESMLRNLENSKKRDEQRLNKPYLDRFAKMKIQSRISKLNNKIKQIKNIIAQKRHIETIKITYEDAYKNNINSFNAKIKNASKKQLSYILGELKKHLQKGIENDFLKKYPVITKKFLALQKKMKVAK